ncbi:CRISPR-associated helicase/endonuclease Cas3 [Methanofollis ethanolicus]|uniref:CRISPR-associated helicase/endonuclease Cas3 n=1 Tax=Methanofollis ethanolicus TaxID=488124 RepID=UPI00082FF86B|nr:CRISPR-associated helicase/endonuclease Cas3 [Methanofollis ethanolicus]
MTYYAHSTENPDKTDWQSLEDHLKNVANLASDFARDFNAAEYAYAGGLLHDLGKYSSDFQKRLEGANIRVDHSTAGAKEARTLYHPAQSRILEYIISGHHGGLLNYGSDESGLEERLHKTYLPDYSAYRDEIALPDLKSVRFTPKPISKKIGFSISFHTRMLYSCLVDADSLDTEAFTQPDRSSLRGQYEPWDLLFKKFEDHMAAKMSGAEENRINRYRREIYEQCQEKAALPPGMFSLTVPTGGGKTLSSMAFALEHLKKNGLKRIFYVIPYTSIIEQNADVFRKIFGSRNVLEHHSNFDPETLDRENFVSGAEILKLSSENWDMPIVVTTNVQFFESLFSSKRSRCRKLHSLAKSVIILDEAQMLPTGYLKPCLSALSELVRNYGSTVVICTATQPKLGELLDESVRPVEIVRSPEELYGAFRRVHVRDLGELDDAELSARLKEHRQVLCIVNTRSHAKKLYDALPGSGACYHLSARMCPVHRRKVLAEIKTLLEEGAECRVISTQLIEAGVDIDFPVVYRAMTGVDSIAQAAGRCNREGRLASGEVYVFRSTEPHGRATSWQRRVAEIGEMVLDGADDPLALSAVGEYFQKLYFYEGDDGLDKKRILPSLEDRCRELAFPFEDIDAAFSIIDEGTKEIIIPYDDNARSIIQELQNAIYPGKVARKLQGYTVSVYPNEFKELERARAIDLIGDRFYVLKDKDGYSEETGLLNRNFNGSDGSLLII